MRPNRDPLVIGPIPRLQLQWSFASENGRTKRTADPNVRATGPAAHPPLRPCPASMTGGKPQPGTLTLMPQPQRWTMP